MAGQSITLRAEDVTEVARLLERLVNPQEAIPECSLDSAQTDCNKLIAVAKLVQVLRHSRALHFSKAMFGEPAWDLLVALYIAEEQSWKPTLSTLANDAGKPVSTALRWIDYLDKRKLIRREPSSTDRRTIVVTLSEQGREALQSYFQGVLASLRAASNLI